MKASMGLLIADLGTTGRAAGLKVHQSDLSVVFDSAPQARDGRRQSAATARATGRCERKRISECIVLFQPSVNRNERTVRREATFTEVGAPSNLFSGPALTGGAKLIAWPLV